MKNLAVFFIAILLFSFSVTKAVAQADVNAAQKEITGSAGDGTVLHKDVIYQNAKPGDYIIRKNGDESGQTIVLQQVDIDFSKAEVDRMNKELLDTKPGSVRALLDELIDEMDFELSGEPTEPQEIPYAELKGRVVEYVSDIRNKKQIIVITAHKNNKTFFDRQFKTPPWTKSAGKIPPDLVTFTLAKNVTYSENKIFSFSEDIEGTKKALKAIRGVSESEAYYKSGISHYDNDEYDKAIADFTKAIALDSNYAEAYRARGEAYWLKDDNDKAIADYTSAIEIEPNDALTYFDRGRSYFEKGNYDNAIDDLSKAIAWMPKGSIFKEDLGEAHFFRGRSYFAKNNYDGTIDDLTKAIALLPKDFSSSRAVAYNVRGLSYSYKEKYTKAITDYSKAIKMETNVPILYFNRGMSYYKNEDYKHAIEDYKQCLKLDPNNKDAKYWLAEAQKRWPPPKKPTPAAHTPDFSWHSDILGDIDRYWSVGVRAGTPMIFPLFGYPLAVINAAVDAYINDKEINLGEKNWWQYFSPALTLNANATLSPFPYSFLEIGGDFSFGNPQGINGSDYISAFPYAHYNFVFGDYIYTDKFGYIGLGTGRVFTLVGSPERNATYDTIHDSFTLDAVIGGRINGFNVEGIFRTDFQRGFYFNILFGYSFRLFD